MSSIFNSIFGRQDEGIYRNIFGRSNVGLFSTLFADNGARRVQSYNARLGEFSTTSKLSLLAIPAVIAALWYLKKKKKLFFKRRRK